MRVTECWAVATAERLYTALLTRFGASLSAPDEGECVWTPDGRPFTLRWELRPNPVWRFGRPFLICPRCARRATRIYVPINTAPPGCRECFGLTYQSRQQNNYKDGGTFASIGLSARALARHLTWNAREDRALAAAQRYAERRQILDQRAGSTA